MNSPNKIRSILAVSALATLAAGCSPSQETPASTTPKAPSAVEAEASPAPAASTGAVSDAATRYDNQIIQQPEGGRGKDDGWFLVKEGKRRWITDDKWPAANGYDPTKRAYVTTEEFYAIPEDPRTLPDPETPESQQ